MTRTTLTIAGALLIGVAAGWSLREGAGIGQTVEPPLAKPAPRPALPPMDGKLRIIAFGAHPDDCEIRVGGTAAKWAALGHHVKLVSVTNGDIGHWRQAGGPLAKRRMAEVEKTARILGVHAHVLDIHDGELEPTLEHRRTITRLIREWKADVVLSHRPNDYHPDHRYTGVLVQDAAFMVTVPFFCPDVPHLTENPVFLYYQDRFQRPNPFRPDIIVDIDDVIEKKLACMEALESQFLELGVSGSEELMPKNQAEYAAGQQRVRQRFEERFRGIAAEFRDRIVQTFGKDRGGKIQYIEPFEICEYGRQPSAADLRKLFPFAARE
jgi:LmbE family N-acetylglucosaminyl deacetylase